MAPPASPKCNGGLVTSHEGFLHDYVVFLMPFHLLTAPLDLVVSIVSDRLEGLNLDLGLKLLQYGGV